MFYVYLLFEKTRSVSFVLSTVTWYLCFCWVTEKPVSLRGEIIIIFAPAVYCLYHYDVVPWISRVVFISTIRTISLLRWYEHYSWQFSTDQIGARDIGIVILHLGLCTMSILNSIAKKGSWNMTICEFIGETTPLYKIWIHPFPEVFPHTNGMWPN